MNKEYIISTVFGLLMACPYTQDNSLCDCILYNVRKKYPTPRDKINYIETLSEKELQEIITYHCKCSMLRKNE